MLANPAAQAEAVFVWQHDIEDDQVARRLVHCLAEPRTVGHATDLEAGATEVGLQQFADFLVVVDEENGFTDYAHGGLLVVMAWLKSSGAL